LPRDNQGCATSPLFAYFFRVNVPAAATRLAGDRNNAGNGCYPPISHPLLTPALERQLIADVQSPLPYIRDIAIDVLGYLGPPDALPVLLGVLDKGAEPNSRLLLTIVHGRRWILKNADFATLSKACVGTNLCPEIARVQRELKPPYYVGPFDNFDGHYGLLVASHQLDGVADLAEILAQLPMGSNFRWEGHTNPQSPRERALYEQTQALLVKYGMTLVN
jgi:hypothetical protein